MIDALDITRSLVRCASVTPEDAGAQKIIADALMALGFSCTPLEYDGVKNLFARLGSGAPHFCFAGHTDVVPPGDVSAWTCPPFEGRVADGLLYGRGASDMKGGIGAFLAAVSAFIGKNGRPEGSISVLITGDEEGPAENGTVRVLEWMTRNGHLPDVCLLGEPSNPDALGQEVKIGRRGSLSGTITVTGKQGHVAYPHLADNPLPRLVQLLDGLRIAVFDQGSAHFQPSNLEITSLEAGGVADNVIPPRAQARFNIRFSDRWTGESLSARVREILDRVGIDYEVSFRIGAEAFLSGAGDFAKLVAKAAGEVTGRTPVFSTKGGSSDARFIHKVCPVAEFGLTNATAHHIDECARVDDIRMLSYVYERILGLYFGVSEGQDQAGSTTKKQQEVALL